MEKTYLWQPNVLPAKLFVITNTGIHTYAFDRQLLVGRQTTQGALDIPLGNNFVSRQHGYFGIDQSGWFYSDIGSSNGTYYNGTKLIPNQLQYLNNGDTLSIKGRSVSTLNDIIRIIFVTNYPDNYEWYSLSNLDSIAQINIGRGSTNSLDLNNMNVSAHHSCFYESEYGWNVADFNSTNGVSLNGNRLNGEALLTVGDCIAISNINFVFTGDTFMYQRAMGPECNAPYANDALSIRITERSVWQRTRKLMLLQDINMTINNGELVLILGGSGAGKTTFMNAVMGYEKAEGQILHGNKDIYRDFKSVKHQIGFVPQLDLLRSNDSVYDTLSNAAEMKLSAQVTAHEREERIAVVLETLGLQRESNSLVSKLSGGQRKRLSIAVEYIANPSLFFLDEPDSGLDGIMAKTLMQNLRTIADEHKIVLVISHSPDRVAHLFDKVIVLAKSAQDNCGHLAYFGPINDGIRFFDTQSLEGIVQRINRFDEGGDGLSDYYIDKYKTYTQGGQ